MHKTLLVLRTEIVNVITRRSFLIMTFGVPLIGFVLFMGITSLNQTNPDALENIISAPSTATESEGYVDHSEIIQSLPADTPPDRLIAYPDEEAAQRALENGDISAYYILPTDVLESGELTLIKPDFSPFPSDDQSDWAMRWAFYVNLLGGSEDLAVRVNSPMDVYRVSLAPETGRDQESPLAFVVPYATTMMFYIIILGSASMLLNSVATEKQNRVMEVLMLSVSPRQLLTGKIIGLGITGLLQTIIYTGISYSLLRISGRTSATAANFDLPPSILGWGLLFFLLGYAIYASLMAGVGALVPNLREASQATFVVIFPMIIPMLLMSALIQEPNGTVSLVLSLFPFTAPVAMMTRLAATTVPLWQLLASAGLAVLQAVIIIRAVAGLYRAQVLLSGQEFKVKLFFRALLGWA
jgi:ABC-2 type transport system permease protein